MFTPKALLLLTLLMSIEVIGGLPAVAQTNKPGRSQSVATRLDAARSLTLALEADVIDLTSFARGRGNWRRQPEKEGKLSRDMRRAEETSRELREMQEIASFDQAALIRRVTPLLGDMIDNARSMIEHIKADRSDAGLEYLVAHQEIASHLASLIVTAIDQPKNQKATR